MSRVIGQIKRLIQLPFEEKIFFFEALFFLFTAKILLSLFSFKFCVRFIKGKNCTYKNIHVAQVQLLKNAIDRANKLAFWKNVCLVQSLAARWMLQRRKIASQLSLGVVHDENKKLIAHAWVKVQDFELVKKGLDYKELIFF